jgi:hypothetical protein
MSVLIQGDQVRAIALGIKVDRATATLPQTATGSIFTVTGGRVVLAAILGEVTTVLGATTTSANLVHTPTVGTVGDLCAATVVTSDSVGTLYSITGVPADLMSAEKVGGTVVPVDYNTGMPTRQLILPVGAIGLKTTAGNTGSVKWSVVYVPLDNGATVAAA